jgi:hypothetical protein
MKDLLAERQHALEWIKIFDLKKAAGGVSFSEDHHKSLLCLIAENLTAGLRHNPGHIASGEVLPQEVGIPALPLSQEHLTVESFIDTRSELLSRLRATEKVMDYYGRVIGTDTDEYQALIEAKEAYKKLLSEVEKLAPTFNRLSEVRAEIGIYESHPGEDLTDALLKDRIRQIDFSLYSGHWGAVTNAANHVAQVHPGEVYIDGKIVSLTGAVDFKPDARDHFPPAMGHAIEELNEDFEQQGFHLQVKEGFTPGVYHSSACHYDGTCADIGIGGAQHAYTPEEIYRVFEIAKKHPGISILWENPDPSGFARMQDAYHQYLIHSLGMDPLAAEAKMHHDLKSFSWATAPHFHVHCENCERAGSSLNPLSGTAVNENAEPELAMTGS